MLWEPYQATPAPATPVDWTRPLAQGLAAFWTLAEGAGFRAYDAASGQVLAIGSGDTWTASPTGAAVAIPGSGTRAMTAPLPPGITATTPWSLLVRCRRTDGATGLANLVSVGDGTNCLVVCDYFGTSNGLLVDRAVNDNAHATIPTVAVSQSAWHDILLTWDGSSSACRLYVDGADVTSTPTTGANHLGMVVAAGLNIGASGGVTSPAMAIATVAMWSRALSAGEAAFATTPAIYGRVFGAPRAAWLVRAAGIASPRVRRTFYVRAGSRGVA